MLPPPAKTRRRSKTLQGIYIYVIQLSKHTKQITKNQANVDPYKNDACLSTKYWQLKQNQLQTKKYVL